MFEIKYKRFAENSEAALAISARTRFAFPHRALSLCSILICYYFENDCSLLLKIVLNLCYNNSTRKICPKPITMSLKRKNKYSLRRIFQTVNRTNEIRRLGEAFVSMRIC